MQGKVTTPEVSRKREFIYQRTQIAGQMEVLMLIVAAIALAGAVFAFLSYGWLPSLALLILSSLAYGVSRLFDLMGDLIGSIGYGLGKSE